MNSYRRNFLCMSVPVMGLAFSGLPVIGQTSKSRTALHPPDPAEPPGTAQLATGSLPSHKFANEKEFRDCLERLFESTHDLREEMRQLQFTEVFSVRICKETEVMERLAKRLKQLAKG